MILIKIKRYFMWILVNFILCLLPITVYLLVENSVPQVFSGFLSFSYTILIVSFYLFLGHYNKKTTEKPFPELTMWLTWTSFFCIWAFFWMYNYPISPCFINFVNTHIVSFFVFILIWTFLVSLLLSIPLIRDSINDEVTKRKIQGAERTGERTRRFKDELEQEGNRA